MRLIPVIDLKGGTVVHGVGGRRDQYRPIVSQLSPSPDPLDVARSFRDKCGLSEYYLADLDAIGGAEPALGTYAAIRSLGCSLWVDAGLRDAGHAAPLRDAGIEKIVAGLETIRGPVELATLCGQFGRDRIVFSLDLKNGVPLGVESAWGRDPRAIAECAVEAGVNYLIVLDLARVGSSAGPGTEGLCEDLARTFPDVEIIAGGGVRELADLHRLERIGVRAALVASALHDGRLCPEDLHRLARHQVGPGETIVQRPFREADRQRYVDRQERHGEDPTHPR
jgi:phosphoribosylformimino-5-aminoimidazole carboxamide ribotide isomerase